MNNFLEFINKDIEGKKNRMDEIIIIMKDIPIYLPMK